MRVQPGVSAIFGKTFTGKTTLALKRLKVRGCRALIFDPRAAESLDAVSALTSRASVRAFLAGEASRAPSWIRAVRFDDVEHYAWLAATVERWRGVVWVMDDARVLLQGDESRRIERAAVSTAISGRHFGSKAGVELWVIAHRPFDVPTNVRGQIERLTTFRQTEPLDLAWLRQRVGPEFSARVAELADHQSLDWPEGWQ